MILPTRQRASKDVIELVTAPIEGTTAGGKSVVQCARVVTQTTLDRLYYRGLLSKDENDATTLLDAGNRLHNDWHIGGFQPAVTVNLFGVHGGLKDLSERQIDARRRFNRSMNDLEEEKRSLAYDLCCLNYSVRKLEHDRKMRHGTGVKFCRLTLTALAIGYGMFSAHYRLT